MAIPELRVHGVSGTPPRDMLYTDPVESVAGHSYPIESQRHVKVFRQTTPADFAVHRQTRAFHWGGLTSGSWLTALWVLMLPFSMANLAGWTARRRSRASIAWVRLFGLVLTAVFLNMALTVVVDFSWQWSGNEGWSDGLRRWAIAGVFLTLGWAWWGLISWASTRSHFMATDGRTRRRYLWSLRPADMIPEQGPQGDAAWLDPADAPVTDTKLWQIHPILHRLRRIHFGFGYLILAFAAAAASNTGWEIPGWAYFDVPTAVMFVLLVLPIVALVRTGRPGVAPAWLRRLTAALPGLGALSLVAASVLVGSMGVDETASGHWPHLRDTSVAILATAIAVLLAVALTAGRISATALTVGTFFGVVMGAGAAFPLDRILGENTQRITGLDWLAISTLVWLLVVTAVTLFAVARRLDRNTSDLWRAVHESTGSLSGVFAWVPATGLIAAVATFAARCASVEGPSFVEACFQTGSLASPPAWVRGAAILTAALVWVAAVHLLVRWGKGGLALLAVLIVPALAFLLRDRIIPGTEVELSLEGVVTAARVVAIALPASLLLTRLIGGLRGNSESRRGFSVIWDVVMFWPRWFHPLAPPAYGPHAVQRLRDEIRRRLVEVDGSNTRPLVLAAHSQGTILSTVAVATLAGARSDGDGFELTSPQRLDRLGLLTYGCPLVHLYDKYFPSAKFADLAESLSAHLGGRWANLHRPTDPIGGPVLKSIDVYIEDPVSRRLPCDKRVEESVWSTFRQWWWNAILRKSGPLPPKPTYRGHSHYEPTEEFIAERRRISPLL